MENKTCSKCKQSKLLSEFGKDNSAPGGLKYWCKQCCFDYRRLPKTQKRRRKYIREWNERNRKRNENYINKYRYGLTTKERKALIASVDSRCEVCGIEEKYLTKGLFIHHNHQTNKIEGILCSNCNCASGLLGEDVSRVRALLAFLERVKQKGSE